MKSLQNAIKRARLERQGVIGSIGQAGAASEEWTAAPPRRGRKHQPIPDPIEYTQTRRVYLNALHLERTRVIASQTDDERVEAYRQLRTQVLHTFESEGFSSLAITSPYQGAGKTLTSVNLAISLSHETNNTVLLVDLDLQKPDVHRVLGVEVELGVVDVVEGRAELPDVLINPMMPRLVVLPGRHLGRPSSELLSSMGMRKMVADITRRYDRRLIVFDLPPLLRNDDALKFAPYADATLLVVEEGSNTPEEVERSMHLLRHANLIGTVLNKSR